MSLQCKCVKAAIWWEAGEVQSPPYSSNQMETLPCLRSGSQAAAERSTKAAQIGGSSLIPSSFLLSNYDRRSHSGLTDHPIWDQLPSTTRPCSTVSDSFHAVQGR